MKNTDIPPQIKVNSKILNDGGMADRMAKEFG